MNPTDLMFKVDKENLQPGEEIFDESECYYLYGYFESVYLISKKSDRPVAYVGEFYGEAYDGIIDQKERFCVTVGDGYIIYPINHPLKEYDPEKDEEWIIGGTETVDRAWYEKVEQLNDDEVELTNEYGKKEILNVSKAIQQAKARH